MIAAVTAEPPVDKVERIAGDWIQTQALNVSRHAAALRPFRKDEFGTGAEAPTEAHINGVNRLFERLHPGLRRMTGTVQRAARVAVARPSTATFQRLVRAK